MSAYVPLSEKLRPVFEEAFEYSLVTMFSRNPTLFVRDLREECINCAFLLILREMFPKYIPALTKFDFDMEYDKQGYHGKKMSGKSIRPDILIHKRGNPRSNFLFIEAKKNYLTKHDKSKIVQALKPPFNYMFSVGLRYSPSRENCTYVIAEHGQPFKKGTVKTVNHPNFKAQREKEMLREARQQALFEQSFAAFSKPRQ